MAKSALNDRKSGRTLRKCSLPDFDTIVKLNIYQTLAETTQAPTSAEVALALDRSIQEVEAAFQRPQAKSVAGFRAGTTSRIRMAPPFSGIKTPFAVAMADQWQMY